VGTNYYVNTPSCPSACEHCTESERIHLGKSSMGWQFIFRADPDWPRDEAFAHWVRRALSGPIVDEYGRECSLAELIDLVYAKIGAKVDTSAHLNAFTSCGHTFSARGFS
jgi:hypothetical protein